MSLARPAIVAALLIVAVIGLRAWAGGSLSSGGPLQAYLGTAAQAGATLAVAVTAGFAAFVVALNIRRARKRGTPGIVLERPPVPRWIRLVALLIALAFVSLLIGLPFALHTRRSPTVVHGVRPGQPPPQPAPPPTNGPTAGSVVLYLLIAAIVLGVLLALYVSRRRGPALPAFAVPEEGPAEEDARGQLVEAVRAGRRTIDRSDDPRSAIIACYAAMEQVLADAGTPRRPADTPGELLERVTDRGTVRSPAARALTSLFHEARYSRHPLDESDRRMATAALDEISRDLRPAQETQGTP
ncbi:MAG: DUF4129 domain-containing protein [Streptosporangiaceae bacterium]